MQKQSELYDLSFLDKAGRVNPSKMTSLQHSQYFNIRGIHDAGEGVQGGGGIVPRRILSPLPSSSLVSSNRVIQTKGNRRSLHFFYAKEYFSRVVELGAVKNFELGLVVRHYLRWRAQYRMRYIHLSKGDCHVFIKQFSRFDLCYGQFLRRKLRLLDFMLWDLKIELTLDPKKFMRLKDEFDFINRAWNKLRSWLRCRYGDFEFLRVLELSKMGRPHLHILISGIKWIPQKDLSEVWDSYGGGKIVYVKRVYRRNNLKACAYVLKYVNKTISEAKKSDRVYSALLFASNRRLFGLSKGCQNMINAGRVPKGRKGFRFCSSVNENLLIEFCNEKGVEIKNYLVVEACFQDYREFQDLFWEGGDYG